MKENSKAHTLVEAFESIREKHADAVRRRASRIVPSGSVIRVFKRGTAGKLRAVLHNVPIDELKNLKAHQEFDKWFVRELNNVAGAIRKNNPNNRRIGKGYRWGHAAKVLMLYIREVVLNSRYFTDDEVQQIGPWLYAPVDSWIIKELKKKEYGLQLPFSNIKGIDTRTKFHFVQRVLGEAARKAGVPRVWFDDIWALR